LATTVLETVTGTASFVAIKNAHYGFKGFLTAQNTNGGDILVRKAGSGISGIPLPAGARLQMLNPEDLNLIEIKGNTYVLILDGVTDVGW